MDSDKCTIQVHVRRTGEFVFIEVIPFLTTYGHIVKMVCEKIDEPEESHYYLAMNSEIEMKDDMIFQPIHKDRQFKLIMKTKWLLEYIAEQLMQRQRLSLSRSLILDTDTTITEAPSTPPLIIAETPQEPQKMDTSIPTNIAFTDVTSASDTSSEVVDDQSKSILGDVVRSTIKKIPSEEVQAYLHRALGKAFDILLMGSPRVGKSTLINAILKKNIAETSAGRNKCTETITHYEYEETYTSPIDGTSSTCLIRVWDTPGIEDWTKLDVAKYVQNLVKEKNPICLIFCASPGSHVEVEHLKVVIEQCKRLKVLIALVVTNMYASDEVDNILETFQKLLAHHSIQTDAIDDVFYYGTVGLCAAVNSIEYEVRGTKMKPAGVHELMLGIMTSLSEEKLLQWCFALMDNGQFWAKRQSRIWKAFSYIKKLFRN